MCPGIGTVDVEAPLGMEGRQITFVPKSDDELCNTADRPSENT